MNTPISEYAKAVVLAEIAKRGRGAQSVLADNAGVSRSAMNDFVKGRKSGSDEFRAKIATALGYTYEDMLKEGRRLLTTTKYNDAPPGLKHEHDEAVAVRDKMMKDPAWDYPDDPLTEEENAKVKQGEVITRKVLTSRTKFSKALWENLKAFESAVDTEAEMKGMKEEMQEMKALMLEIRDAQIVALEAGQPEKKQRNQNGSGC